MLALLEFFQFLTHRHHDHDGVDNLNTRVVCMYALAVGFLLFASEYGVSSIQCFDKASWQPSWKQYTDDLCFIEGSYFVNTTEKLPKHADLPKSVKVDFYQWTPFIFLLIALLFHAPRIFWAALNSTSHLYFHELCETSMECRENDHKECVRRFEVVSTSSSPQMPAHLGNEKINKKYDEKISDKYLIISYIFMKVWHIINVIVATLFLCLLTPPNDPLGFKTVFNVVTGVDWRISGAFPRVTTCAVRIRHYDLGRYDRLKTEQSQCFLAANNYVEKLFVATWILFAFLFATNVHSLIVWIKKIRWSKYYVVEIFRARYDPTNAEEKTPQFLATVADYANVLLPDARFAILMAAAQSRDLVCGTLLTYNFKQWKSKEKSDVKA